MVHEKKGIVKVTFNASDFLNFEGITIGRNNNLDKVREQISTPVHLKESKLFPGIHRSTNNEFMRTSSAGALPTQIPSSMELNPLSGGTNQKSTGEAEKLLRPYTSSGKLEQGTTTIGAPTNQNRPTRSVKFEPIVKTRTIQLTPIETPKPKPIVVELKPIPKPLTTKPKTTPTEAIEQKPGIVKSETIQSTSSTTKFESKPVPKKSLQKSKVTLNSNQIYEDLDWSKYLTTLRKTHVPEIQLNKIDSEEIFGNGEVCGEPLAANSTAKASETPSEQQTVVVVEPPPSAPAVPSCDQFPMKPASPKQLPDPPAEPQAEFLVGHSPPKALVQEKVSLEAFIDEIVQEQGTLALTKSVTCNTLSVPLHPTNPFFADTDEQVTVKNDLVSTASVLSKAQDQLEKLVERSEKINQVMDMLLSVEKDGTEALHSFLNMDVVKAVVSTIVDSKINEHDRAGLTKEPSSAGLDQPNSSNDVDVEEKVAPTNQQTQTVERDENNNTVVDTLHMNWNWNHLNAPGTSSTYFCSPSSSNVKKAYRNLQTDATDPEKKDSSTVATKSTPKFLAEIRESVSSISLVPAVNSCQSFPTSDSRTSFNSQSTYDSADQHADTEEVDAKPRNKTKKYRKQKLKEKSRDLLSANSTIGFGCKLMDILATVRLNYILWSVRIVFNSICFINPSFNLFQYNQIDSIPADLEDCMLKNSPQSPSPKTPPNKPSTAVLLEKTTVKRKKKVNRTVSTPVKSLCLPEIIPISKDTKTQVIEINPKKKVKVTKSMTNSDRIKDCSQSPEPEPNKQPVNRDMVKENIFLAKYGIPRRPDTSPVAKWKYSYKGAPTPISKGLSTSTNGNKVGVAPIVAAPSKKRSSPSVRKSSGSGSKLIDRKTGSQNMNARVPKKKSLL